MITVGHLSDRTKSENYVREILSGSSLQEILTFTLTSPEKLSTLMGYDESVLRQCVEVSNPVSSSYSVMRNRLFPGLLDFLSRNTHNEYPQYLFEVGEVVSKEKSGITTRTNAAVVLADTDVSFGHIHSIFETLSVQLGIQLEITEITHPEFLEGRSAKILLNNTVIGTMGEVSPAILEKWQVFMPTAALEIDLSLISTLDLPPIDTY